MDKKSTLIVIATFITTALLAFIAMALYTLTQPPQVAPTSSPGTPRFTEIENPSVEPRASVLPGSGSEQ